MLVARLGLRLLGWLALASAFLFASNTAGRAQLQRLEDEKTDSSTPTIVTSLKVRVVTHNRRGAGTDNAVYFDVGPLAWKLNQRFRNDFEAGDDDIYTLSVPKGFTTDDILWLRLHKKGLAGYTGTRDGLFGAWHPASVTLFVNGAEFKTAQPEHALNSRCWYWRSNMPDDFDLSLFTRSLRIKPNEKLSFIGRATGFFTTNVFKKKGISGWLMTPFQKECSGRVPLRKPSTVCVIGEVLRKASSTDCLQTIDLKAMEIHSCPHPNQPCTDRVVVDHAHGFKLPRHIRIENRYKNMTIPIRSVVRICGTLLWDTDEAGWWEIHPRSNADLQLVSTGH